MLFAFFLQAGLALALEVHYPSILGKSLNDTSSVGDLFCYVINLITSLATTVAVIVIAYGGLYYLVSYGRGKFTDEGKDWVKAGILGLLLVLASTLIAGTINPQLTSCKVGVLSLINLPNSSATSVTAPPGVNVKTFQEIPIGTLTENLLTRTMDCYGFDSNGDPIDGDKLSTGEAGPTFIDHDRADCLTQLVDGAQKKSQVIAALSDEITKLMDECNCQEYGQCDNTCGGQGGCDEPTTCPNPGGYTCTGKCVGAACKKPASDTPKDCCPTGVKDTIEHGPIAVSTDTCTSGGTGTNGEGSGGNGTGGGSSNNKNGSDNTNNVSNGCESDANCAPGYTCEAGECTPTGDNLDNTDGTNSTDNTSNSTDNSSGNTDTGDGIIDYNGQYQNGSPGIADLLSGEKIFSTAQYTATDKNIFVLPINSSTGTNIYALTSVSSDMTAGFNEVQDHMKSGFNDVQDHMKSGFNDVQDHMAASAADIKSHMCSGFGDVQNHMKSGFNDIQNHMKSGFNDIQNHMKSGFADVQSHMQSGAADIQNNIKKAAADIQKDMTKAANDMQSNMKKSSDDVQKNMKKAADDMKSNLSSGSATVKNDLKKAAADMKNDMKKTAADMKNDMKKASDDAKSDLNSTGNTNTADASAEISALNDIIAVFDSIDNEIGADINNVDSQTEDAANTTGDQLGSDLSKTGSCGNPQYNGLDEFRCPNPKDESTPCSNIPNFVEKQIQANGKTFTVIDQDKWSQLNLWQQLTYFKEKIPEIEKSVQKDEDELDKARSALSSCYLAVPYVDLVKTYEQTDQTETIVLTDPEKFVDTGTKKPIDISKYCTGFNYNNSSCLKKCNDACPDSSNGAMLAYKNCGECQGSNSDCLSKQEKCIEDAYNSRPCPNEDVTDGSAETFSDCISTCQDDCSNNCGKEYSPGSEEYTFCQSQCDNNSQCVLDNAGDCLFGSQGFVNCATQTDPNDPGNAKYCINNAYLCKNGSNQYAGYPDCAEPSSSNNTQGYNYSPNNKTASLASVLTNNKIFSTAQYINTKNSKAIILADDNGEGEGGDSGAADDTQGTTDPCATVICGNSQYCFDGLCYDNQTSPAGGSNSGTGGSGGSAGTGAGAGKTGGDVCATGNYSASFFYDHPECQKCSDPYDPAEKGTACYSKSNADASCQELCPETTKCPASSFCPACSCDQIDQTLNFCIPNESDQSNEGEEGYAVQAQPISAHQIVGPQCNEYSNNDDPLTFYCEDNFWDDPQREGNSPTPIGTERICSQDGEVPVGQTVDAAKNWAGNLKKSADGMVKDIQTILDQAKKIGKAKDTDPVQDYCKCSAEHDDSTPICTTGCGYSEQWIPPTTGTSNSTDNTNGNTDSGDGILDYNTSHYNKNAGLAEFQTNNIIFPKTNINNKISFASQTITTSNIFLLTQEEENTGTGEDTGTAGDTGTGENTGTGEDTGTGSTDLCAGVVCPAGQGCDSGTGECHEYASGGSGSGGTGTGTGGEGGTSEGSGGADGHWECSCNFTPCDGSPCEQITDYLSDLWNDIRQFKIDFIAFYTTALTEPRSDIMKELTYSRQKTDSCSQVNSEYSVATRLIDCTRVRKNLMHPINGGEIKYDGTAVKDYCYGTDLGNLFSKDLTDNWFCCQEFQKTPTVSNNPIYNTQE